MKKHKVAISKVYFSKEFMENLVGTEFYEVVDIYATTRVEAANIVWRLKERDWLSKIVLNDALMIKIFYMLVILR